MTVTVQPEYKSVTEFVSVQGPLRGAMAPLPPQRLECRAESVGPTRDKSKSHRAPSLEAALVGRWAGGLALGREDVQPSDVLALASCLQGLIG